MPTLYVENVPEDLYEAVRAQARAHRKSISAEVLTLLEENVPTADELARRRELLRRVRRMRAGKTGGRGRPASAEEMQREDRER